MYIAKHNLDKDGVYIIAELSANHNGSLELAKQSIKAAKSAGANAIKLQTYRADTLTLNSKNPEFMITGGLWAGESLYELYEKAYTPWEWHKELFEYADNLGIDIFSSPFDKSAIDFLEQFNPIAYKIASFEITDFELIRYAASKGKPMIISTGIASIDEIEQAVNICKSENNNNIILLHCVSAYPAPLENANLKTIPNMAETFGVRVGFSDHTIGLSAPIAAVSLGAKVIEKHFILDKSVDAPDVAFSLDKDEFSLMVKAVRETEALLGNVEYGLNEQRSASRMGARSLYASCDIKKGDIISLENIKSVRPFCGLHPKYLNDILGKKAACDISFATPLSFKHIEL